MMKHLKNLNWLTIGFIQVLLTAFMASAVDSSDLPIATVISNDPAAYESGDPGEFTITISEPAPAPQGLRIHYTLSGSAISGGDCAPLPSTVKIPARLRNVQIRVDVITSIEVEGEKKLRLDLLDAPEYMIGLPWAATIHVFDFDAPPAGARNYYVSSNGSNHNPGTLLQPFQTIQKAADTVLPGDTVYVMAGVYRNTNYTTDHQDGTSQLSNGNVVNVNTSGTPGKYITFAAYPYQNNTKPKIEFDGRGGFRIGSNINYIIIDGFEVEGSNKLISYQQAEDHRWTKEPYYTGRGIYSWGPCHHIYVRNCYVHHTAGSGIRFNKADYIVVENCVVANCTWWTSSAESAVVLAEAIPIDTNDVVKMLYTRNIVYNNWNLLPFCNSSKRGTGTYGDGFNYPGHIIDGQGLYVTRNNTTYTHGRMRFENNITYNNGFGGCVYHKTDRGEMVNNVCYQNGAYPRLANYSGLTLNTCNDVKVYNNILWARKSSDFSLKNNGGTTNIDARNNLIAVGRSSYVNTNGLMGNPLFKSAPDISSIVPDSNEPNQIGDAIEAFIFDFTVDALSPTIDNGTSLLAPADDHDTRCRPLGLGVDIGAYEYAKLAWQTAPGDFDGDGKVDLKDFSKFAKYWLADEPWVDIAPAPYGDGIVDYKDLAVLADYWLTAWRIPPLPTPASNPNPANDAFSVDLNADLSWTAEADAASHDVYFGTTDPPPFIRNQTETIFDPGTMTISTMYFWRIDEVNAWGKTTGTLWYFTTESGPPPL